MSTPATREVTFGERTYSLDEHGFLLPSDQWDEAFAEGMALLQGIYGGLTDDHWRFIRYLRSKFLDEHTVPLLVFACADNSIRLSKLHALFPTGYHRGACRIAGLNFEFMKQVNIWHTYETPPAPTDRYPITATGFLERFEDWDEGFAARVAAEWQLPGGLTDRHRQIIHYLRDHYRNHRNIPTAFRMCADNQLDLDEFRALFPGGYRRGACRMAGLPFFP
jgi:tRNA 2-thiouridine synthesizing protein E